jgi:ABC-type branched-subunit amino acid transport system ATPase component/branched-subunit amino acid ABC-type transport system permease component
MSDFLPYIVAGLAAGAVYGLAGTGLVLTYKTSGIFNFAYPAMAAIAAYVFFFIHQDTVYLNVRWSWPIAAIISVLVVGPLMGLAMEALARGLANVATSLQVLATIGLSLGIIGFLGLFYQNSPGLAFNPFLPQSTFDFLGTNVGWDQLTLFLFATIGVIVLYEFFRLSRLGMAMRAVVDNPDLMSLTGTSATVVRRWAWLIGSTFAAASGVLLGPTVGALSAGSFFTLIIASFGAAALGLFSSLPLTFGGGLLIGILGSLASKYETNISWLAGVNPAFPFLVLFVVLIAIKRSRLVDSRVVRPRPLPRSYYAPWQPRLGLGVVVVAALATIPFLLPRDISLWAAGLVYVILLLSLGLLVKESGQVSLAQTSFAAVGGVAFAHSAAQWGFPWFVALIFSGVVAAAVGMLVAIPAIRVSGVFLALATLGFGLALQSLVYPTSIMFTKSVDGLPNIPRPNFAQTDKAFYFLLLACTVVTALIMLSIRFGRLGRLLRGLADSPLALNTMGTSVSATRLIVFAISAFFAGIAGALYGSFFQGIGLETPLFQPVQALQLFCVVMLVTGGTPWFALQAGIAVEVIPAYFSRWFPSLNIGALTSLLFGVSACFIAVQADRLPGAPQFVRTFCEQFRKPKVVATDPDTRPVPEGQGLKVDEVSVRFGGVAAVSYLTLEAPFGQITGLIGPNGAGKTTTFNACSGLVRPATGRVTYHDNEVTGLSPAARARLGIGRTFQQAELWDTLTVRENVELGCEAPVAGRSAMAQLVSPSKEHHHIEAAAVEAMTMAGVAELAERRVGDLSTGQRRLVELARVLAAPFELLLLDEPSSGLDKEETERFGEVLQRVIRERGTGILLVEHDMQLVMNICKYIYVMDFGQKIFEGTPNEVASSDIVRAAYLGSEELEVALDDSAVVERDDAVVPSGSAVNARQERS